MYRDEKLQFSIDAKSLTIFKKYLYPLFFFFFYSLIFCGRPRLDNDLRGFESLEEPFKLFER